MGKWKSILKWTKKILGIEQVLEKVGVIPNNPIDDAAIAIVNNLEDDDTDKRSCRKHTERDKAAPKAGRISKHP